MQIEQKRLSDPIAPNSLLVVIDVLRAFTTAAFAFGGGVKKIFVTRTVQEALELQLLHPDAFLVGEKNGQPIEHFHFANSPAQIAATALHNATLIQRTTCGTQGLLLSSCAHILAASFVVAEATYQRICQLSPPHLTFLITGNDDADEDIALADYLTLKLQGANPPLAPFLKRVEQSTLARKFLSFQNPRLTQDIHLALQANQFPFAMELSDHNVLIPIYTAPPDGHLKLP
jgi:2-phosphosulfolactate phosphatase